MNKLIVILITSLILAACQPANPTLPSAQSVDVPQAVEATVLPTSMDTPQSEEIAPPAVVSTPQSSETAAPADIPASQSASGAVVHITPNRSEPGDGFGQAVAADGETIVVGAPLAEGRKGAVYVFVREGNQWRETSRLTAADGMANDVFGQSVAISGETLVIGASGHPALGFATGAAYVFQYQQGSWVQTQKLTSSTALDIRFGWSVAIDGQTIVVGAPYRSDQGEIINVGSAIVFANDGQGWVQQARLTGRSGGARSSDQFGWSVAIRDSTLAVGAHLANAVYLYRLSNGVWQEEAFLKGNGNTGQFGYSVSLAQDTLAVGAPTTSDLNTRAGAAFVYMRQPNGWAETAQLSSDGLRPGSLLGWSVDLHGDVIVAGARESDGLADLEKSGVAYAYQLNGGSSVLLGEFYASNPARFDHFGHAVAVTPDFILVGAPGQDAASGSVYVISLG